MIYLHITGAEGRMYMRVTRHYMNGLAGANGNSSTSLLQRALSRSSKGKKSSRSALLNAANSRANLLTQNIGNAVQTQKLYYNMKYRAGQVMDYADKLTDKSDQSLFAKARESGDTSELVANIKGFISNYNGMLENLRDSGSRADVNYLTQFNSISKLNSSALAACGVTRNSDGTLTVDDKKLAEADIDTLEKAWSGNSSFASRAGLWADSVESNAERNMTAKASNAYSSLFDNYGNRGNYFNFFR